MIGGAANGAIQPAANRYLTRTVSRHRQGLAFGVKLAAIPAATLLSGLAVPAVAHTAGWRSAFVAAGAAAAAAGALVRRSPSTKTVPHTNDRLTMPATEPPTPDPQFARSPLLVLLWASAAANAMAAFFVLSAVSIGENDGHAGLTVARASVASVLVRPGIGARADRRNSGHLRLVAIMCGVGAVGPLLLAAGDRHLLVFTALVGYAIEWGWAVQLRGDQHSSGFPRPSHRPDPGRRQRRRMPGTALLRPDCRKVRLPTAWIGASLVFLASALIIPTGRRALLASRALG